MKATCFFLAALVALGQTTTLSDTLLSSVGGTAWPGRITVTLNGPGSAQPLSSGTTSLAGWAYTLCLGVTGADCTSTHAAGVISLTMYTNAGITPTGTSYTARYQPSGSRFGWSETWIVGSGHTKLWEIRGTTVPTPIVMFAPGQISQGGATIGQALVWNGSSWAPATVGGGSVYTASAVIDVASVPDGTCVLDTTAVTVTGAALGGRPTLGASYQPPEAIQIEAKVTGPNSMKVEVCNHSGASYNPASATYYFGVFQ